MSGHGDDMDLPVAILSSRCSSVSADPRAALREIYLRGQVLPREDFELDPFTPIDAIDLREYAAICRALVRAPGDWRRRAVIVLVAHRLTPARWERIRAAWSERIRTHPAVHAEFGRLYAQAFEPEGDGPDTPDTRNE
jgi:hypothetical protein